MLNWTPTTRTMPILLPTPLLTDWRETTTHTGSSSWTAEDVVNLEPVTICCSICKDQEAVFVSYRHDIDRLLYDIKHCATVITMIGNIKKVKVSNRNHLRWLNQKIREHDEVQRRFTAWPYFLTDGITLSATYVDWIKGKRDDMSARYLKELRRTTREHLVHVYHPLPVTDPDLSIHYQE